MNEPIIEMVTALGKQLCQRDWRLAVAESCTGGWIAKVITDIAGSSLWFERGFVTYSNLSKQELLGVSTQVLQQHGAVSAATATAMVKGAITHSNADVALAVTGIAGPNGAMPTKPVGTVWFAWVVPGSELCVHCRYFSGDRNTIRYQAVQYALLELLDILQEL
ncbi:damage-inducible protein CinA [Achromatium sp. WMS1]|nr:damage-inducible protein CinA [Achromatium sp. WMS1]